MPLIGLLLAFLWFALAQLSDVRVIIDQMDAVFFTKPLSRFRMTLRAFNKPCYLALSSRTSGLILSVLETSFFFFSPVQARWSWTYWLNQYTGASCFFVLWASAASQCPVATKAPEDRQVGLRPDRNPSHPLRDSLWLQVTSLVARWRVQREWRRPETHWASH